MKILVVCQYYYPEPFRISDICEELVKLGHEVTVLTGVPNYPEGEVYKGYQNGEHRDEIINGVHVIRSYTIPRKKGSLYRLLNYYSYAVSSSLMVLLNKVKPTNGGEFDIVFVNQLSPVMMAYAGMLYSWKHKKKLLLYCLDLWPESLAAGGIKPGSIVYKLFDKISRHIYKSCDHILVTSYSFIDYLSKKYHIDGEKISYLPQYAEDIFSDIGHTKEKDSDKINLVFAGNIGKVQSVQTIIEAAEILRDEKGILFHIVGGGTDLARLQAMVEQKGLTNVIFYGRRPLEEMPKFYAMADAMLVTLAKDPLLSLTLPGKVQSYMAAGKPIIGAIDGETKAVVEKAGCGFIGEASNGELFVNNVRKFVYLSEGDRQVFSKKAKEYYYRNFSKRKFTSNFLEILFNIKRRCLF